MTTEQDPADPRFQLSFLVQHAAEGVLVTQADGYLVRLNPAAAAMLGISPGDVLGEHIAQVFRHQPDLLRLLLTPGDQQAELGLPHKRIATGFGVDRPAGGRIVLLHDVTERRDIDSRREVLIRQIAHDLRNPLNAVSGYAELVGKFGALTPDQSRYLLRVRETTDKLYELAATLVDLAWIEAGMALEHAPFVLARLIREAITALRDEAQARDVGIAFSIQDPMPTIIGDARCFRQAITYLLENALRYSWPGSNVAIHAWQDGATVYCSVGDRGFGIAPDELDHVWDRMWRSPDPRVRAVPGGGIGLTFARAIVERHGGRIWLESTPDVGTTCTFMLPLAEGW